MKGIGGIHDVTVITGDVRGNLDFYRGVPGMRLEETVNQDDVSA